MSDVDNSRRLETNHTKPLPQLYKNKEDCCGCSACSAICPAVADVVWENGKSEIRRGAIHMEADEEGFLYPMIDKSICVRCYKCIEVCPIKHDM